MKVINEQLKELKQQADTQGIDYPKNADENKMRQILWTSSDTWSSSEGSKNEQVENLQAPQTSQSSPSMEDYKKLLADFQNLKSLVETTADSNKVRDFERSKNKLDNFAFSLKLYPENDNKYPVVSWKMKKNYVGTNLDGIVEDQQIEVTYEKDGELVSKIIPLIEFTRTLERTGKILASEIKNLDGSDVYIQQEISKDTKLQYYVMRPKEQDFYVTLNVNWKDVKVLSTYLNA